MIAASLSSVYSNVQESLEAFCIISSVEVATPPALAAFPGPNRILASWKTRIPAGVVGILAPSHTAIQPFFTNMAALFPLVSFWVADGSAKSQGTSQMEPL